MTLDDLCSPDYRSQLREMFADHAWSGGGVKYLNEVVGLCKKVGATSVLDYGCGGGELVGRLQLKATSVVKLQAGTQPAARLLDLVRVSGYDPGVPGREALPEPADVVVCVDVLEHVEPDRVSAVLRHLWFLTNKVALIQVATRAADKRLPDGRNAHLTIDNGSWWFARLSEAGPWKGRVIKNDLVGLHSRWFVMKGSADV